MSKTITDMKTAYDPQAIEAGWYTRWEKAGLFTADTKSDKPKYTICLPPPNVTGELHMGHALNGTVQDIWARYRRMTGYEVLFLPGTDHAAIATQNVIEKRLAKEGGTKEEIGRDAFAELVDEWYRTVGAPSQRTPNPGLTAGPAHCRPFRPLVEFADDKTATNSTN